MIRLLKIISKKKKLDIKVTLCDLQKVEVINHQWKIGV